MSSGVIYHEAKGEVRGIIVRRDVETIADVLGERFANDYDRIVEWIEDGVSGGGYDTPDDIASYAILGTDIAEPSTALTDVEIAQGGYDDIYRVDKTGTIVKVQPRLTVKFVKAV